MWFPVCRDKKCQVCNDDDECMQCQEGYTLNRKGVCRRGGWYFCIVILQLNIDAALAVWTKELVPSFPIYTYTHMLGWTLMEIWFVRVEYRDIINVLYALYATNATHNTSFSVCRIANCDACGPNNTCIECSAGFVTTDAGVCKRGKTFLGKHLLIRNLMSHCWEFRKGNSCCWCNNSCYAGMLVKLRTDLGLASRTLFLYQFKFDDNFDLFSVKL